MNTKYFIGQGIILDRMHGMKYAPATVYEVHEDHLIIRTHTGQFVKVKENVIIGTAK
jgi:hypothetical protein